MSEQPDLFARAEARLVERLPDLYRKAEITKAARTLARARRDRGMSRASEHADKVSREWTQRAVECLAAWAPARPPFLAENFRAFAEDVVGKPPDGRTWGAVMVKAAKRGIVRNVGYRKADSSNRSPKVLWAAA